uniref:Fatty acid hydroxylase domain-containing protein n=1 Tax=Aplanochytrium stocchinoi TaxID=215587 RepID=A0A7S3UYT9_9STRA|mmetsp:Transcript_2170/g.2539  ORF Transcript_2170/g.2539 Transcript_2170/m.2539 type:complete len:274 (-) Transcript_2170:471-1292(-)
MMLGSSVVSLVRKLQEKYNLQPWIVFGLLHLSARVVGFWTPNILLYLIEKNKIFLRYKIQPTRAPKSELVGEALKHNIATDAATYWAVAFFFYKLLTVDLKHKDDSETETGIENNKKHGWANIRFGGAAPKFGTMAWQVFLGFLGYDFMFYWSHRLLHSPQFYKRVHKKHHMFHTPIGISSAHEHVVESIFQLFNWYIPLGVVGYLAGDLHACTIFYYNVFRWLEAVDAHSGYKFPFSPFHVIPIFGGATRYTNSIIATNLSQANILSRTCFN